MAQAYGENLKQAMDTLRTHKLRSALTVFGVVLGVSVIMLVAALITGFDETIQENIKQFGADTVFISKWDQGFHGGNRPLERCYRGCLRIQSEHTHRHKIGCCRLEPGGGEAALRLDHSHWATAARDSERGPSGCLYGF